MAREIKSKMVNPFPIELDPNADSLVVFRDQEIDRFNKLITVMKISLSDLISAIDGTVVMSA